jgi:hypothetical protein
MDHISKIKNALKGQGFAAIPNVQCNVTLLRGIPENDFQDSFQQWQHISQSAPVQRYGNSAFTGPFQE